MNTLTSNKETNIKLGKIIIIDFGSQLTQLIAKIVRSNGVYSEIKTYKEYIDYNGVKGVIFSGSHCSVNDPDAPDYDIESIPTDIPMLGICYGAQLIAQKMGASVTKSNKREFGKSELTICESPNNDLLLSIPKHSQAWMSHSDSIEYLTEHFEIIAKTETISVAAYKSIKDAHRTIYGVQFHPEVTHTLEGKKIISNFLFTICKCKKSWTPESFITKTIADIKNIIPEDKKVIMALSGGVDSTVAAILIHKAIGKRLTCIFINNGLLRQNESKEVLDAYQKLDLNIKYIDATADFLIALQDVEDPEQKRKIIGNQFIEKFELEAKQTKDVAFLGQGTIYPDVIESKSVHSDSSKIKSHHNVGGLPEKMNLKLVEPLKMLFKDEVRRFGKALGIPDNILNRHPFPGPGLAIRIIGKITRQKVAIVQGADHIFISELKKYHLYHKVWQAGAILLPIQTVGVMGDGRTYEHVVALRAVDSIDGMTADWCKLKQEFLAHVSNRIINEIEGINRVVYDITSKPPGTIEWE